MLFQIFDGRRQEDNPWIFLWIFDRHSERYSPSIATSWKINLRFPLHFLDDEVNKTLDLPNCVIKWSDFPSIGSLGLAEVHLVKRVEIEFRVLAGQNGGVVSGGATVAVESMCVNYDGLGVLGLGYAVVMQRIALVQKFTWSGVLLDENDGWRSRFLFGFNGLFDIFRPFGFRNSSEFLPATSEGFVFFAPFFFSDIIGTLLEFHLLWRYHKYFKNYQ